MTEQAKGPIKRGVTRYQVLTGCFFVALAVIFIQLFHIQIIDHEMYAKQADAMQTDKQTINAARGEIYVRDTDGNIAPLVMNKTVYTLFADPSSIEDVDEAGELVEQVAGDSLIDGSVDKLSDDELQYVVLAKQLSWEQASEIKEADLYGLGLQADTQRVYPEGTLAAQVLGFVNYDGEGQYGVEQYYNEELSGTPGVLQTITDVSKIPLTIGAKDISIPAVDGTDLVLSIDPQYSGTGRTSIGRWAKKRQGHQWQHGGDGPANWSGAGDG